YLIDSYILLISCFDKLPFLKSKIIPSQASHDTIAIQSDFYILAQRFQCVNVKLDVGSTEEHCANLSLIYPKNECRLAQYVLG
ncbi:hypothetical protein AAUPMC_10388, partial [Pasteurella multocida subsp. multocida str. Anand1_cattle]